MKRNLLTLTIVLVLTAAMLLSGCTAEQQKAAVDAAEAAAESAGTSLEQLGEAAEAAADAAADVLTGDDDWSYISGNGKMIIGYTDYAPMNYMDESGKLIGFDTEFAEAVCAKLGVTPEFVVINWDTKEVELAAKSIDCIWNGLTVTEERKQNMAFSDSYIKNMQVAVIRSTDAETFTDTASMASANLVAEVSSAGESAIKDSADLASASYVAVSKQTDALLEVKAGTADVAILDYTLAKTMVGEGTDYADLQMVPGLELAVEEYAIGFRLGSNVPAKVNEAMSALIADGTLNTIAEKYDLAASLLANQQ